MATHRFLFFLENWQQSQVFDLHWLSWLLVLLTSEFLLDDLENVPMVTLDT